VLNGVREAFLDDGVDEQVLLDLKQLWEKKISETKAVDTTARDPEPVVATKSSNRSANARNANKEAQAAAQQPPPAPPVPPQQHMSQPAQPSQPTITQLHPQQPTIVTNNNHHPMPVNQTPGGPTHVLQAGTNIVLGPSGINYTTAAAQGDGVRVLYSVWCLGSICGD
jgi:hypothetical protein